MDGRDKEDELLIQKNDGETPGKSRRTVIVEPALFLFAVANFPLSTLTQQFIYAKVAESLGTNYTSLTTNNHNNSCDLNKSDITYIRRQTIQAATAQFNMYMHLVEVLPMFFMTMFWGAYSDRAGRKICIILPCVGGITGSLIFMAVIYFDMPIYILFLARIATGTMGSMQLILMATMAYIADVTLPEKRALRMTVLDIVGRTTGSLAFIGTGYWITAAGFFWPFTFVIGVKLLVILYTIFLVPETVHKAENARVPFSWNIFVKTIQMFSKEDDRDRRLKVLLITVTIFITYSLNSTDVKTIFLMNTPLCWGSILMGYFDAFLTGFVCLSSVAGYKILSFCLSEAPIGSLAYLSKTMQSGYMGTASTTVMMFFAPLFGCLGDLCLPMARTIISRAVGPNEQGAALAALAVVQMLGKTVSNVTANQIYRATLYIHHGFMFFVNSFVNAIGAAIFLYLAWIIYKKKIKTDNHGVEAETEPRTQDMDQKEDGDG